MEAICSTKRRAKLESHCVIPPKTFVVTANDLLNRTTEAEQSTALGVLTGDNPRRRGGLSGVGWCCRELLSVQICETLVANCIYDLEESNKSGYKLEPGLYSLIARENFCFKYFTRAHSACLAVIS
jgi:hypothetical protein